LLLLLLLQLLLLLVRGLLVLGSRVALLPALVDGEEGRHPVDPLDQARARVDGHHRIVPRPEPMPLPLLLLRRRRQP